MRYVVREEIGKKSDEIAKFIPLDCDLVQIVLYTREDNIVFDIVEQKPTAFVTKKRLATVYLQRLIDSCYTFDVIIFSNDDDGILLIKKGVHPWYNELPSLLKSR